MADGGDLLVREWSRYGKRRLYVNTADGLTVGWVDLITGTRQVDSPRHEAGFSAAVDGYLHDHPTAHTTTPDADPKALEARADSTPEQLESRTVALSEPLEDAAAGDAYSPVGATQPDWFDLAQNRPGQSIRAIAEEELAAMRADSKVRTFLARAFDANTDERAYRVGADGEETVGARLEKLVEDGWHVLHSVTVGTRDSDIDHILIGPGGVFTVNTKTHPGGRVWVGQYAIKVNGQSQPYLRNSRFEAKRASKLLTKAVAWTVDVTPVLVFLTGTWIPDVTIKQQPDDVWVLDRLDIPRTFKKRPPRLTAAQVEAIFEQARRSTTWMKFPPDRRGISYKE